MIKWNDECLNILETITDEIRKVSEGKRPLPLKNSNKCIQCSLNTVCLPDETAIMTSSDLKGSARAVVPARYDRSLVYVSGYDKIISLNGECLVISSFSGGRQEIPIKDVLSVSIMGTAQISTQCIQSLMENGVKVMFCSSGGWLYGVAGGFTDKNLMV